jgi:hypothetical protein
MRLIDADNLITYIKSTGLGTGIDTSQEDIVKAIEACPVAYATYNFPDLKQYYDNCLECVEQHEQFAKWLEELKSYKDAEEQGLLVRLPCKVGDIVYVDSTILPIEDMECYEDIDNKIPSYFQGRVVSFRFAQRNWVKIAVKAKWLYEWIDDETGPESDYIECEKNFTIPLSMIGKSVFLTREGAEKKLEEIKHEV